MTVKLLNVREAAAALRVSTHVVYGLCQKKLLRHVRVGLGRGKLMVPEEAIGEYLAEREVKATGGEASPKKPAPGQTRQYRHLKV